MVDEDSNKRGNVETARRGKPRRGMAHTETRASKRKRDGEDGPDLSNSKDESNEAQKKLWRCPFSVEREGAIAICKWPPHKDRRSVTFPCNMTAYKW